MSDSPIKDEPENNLEQQVKALRILLSEAMVICQLQQKEIARMNVYMDKLTDCVNQHADSIDRLNSNLAKVNQNLVDVTDDFLDHVTAPNEHLSSLKNYRSDDDDDGDLEVLQKAKQDAQKSWLGKKESKNN